MQRRYLVGVLVLFALWSFAILFGLLAPDGTQVVTSSPNAVGAGVSFTKMVVLFAAMIGTLATLGLMYRHKR